MYTGRRKVRFHLPHATLLRNRGVSHSNTTQVSPYVIEPSLAIAAHDSAHTARIAKKAAQSTAIRSF